jgi:ribosomal protein S18 acetylase RimI-like enzyme
MVDNGTAAALWAPPEKWQTPMSASLPFLPVMLRACGRNLPVALKMLTLMETRHKTQTEPHYYLPFIGTDPDHRGKGQGTALLGDMLRRCDEEGVPAYLESTSMRNQSLYHRHGFQVLEEMHWPNGGPPWWPMWREPQAA